MQNELYKVNNKIVDINKQQSQKLNSVVYFLCTFFFILATDSLWTYTWENRILFNTVNILLVIAIALSIIYLFTHLNITITKTKYSIVPIISIILCMFFNLELSGGYIIKIAFAMIGSILVFCIDFKKLMKAFVKVMIFLSIWSLCLYLMYLTGIIKILPIIKNVSETLLYNGIFSFMPIAGDTLIRNWGPFWEPGAFAIYLTLALIINLFYLKDSKPYKFILFSLTIVSTLSTTGIICSGMVMLTYLFFADTKKRNSIKIIMLLSIILGIIVVLTDERFFVMIFEKLTIDLSESHSFGARLYSIIGNIRIMFKEGLFFGTGIEHYNEIYQRTIINIGYNLDFSNTNTFLVDIARFGWLMGITNIILFYKFSKKLCTNKCQTICIYLILIIALFMENMSYSLFWMTIPYMGLQASNKEKENENNLSM